MSSIPTKQIDGDVAIGRNVAMGGSATVRGSATVGHNLKVEGWLEAKNIKSANKGLFANETDLKNAYPFPHEGWFAGVSATEQDILEIGVTQQEGKALFRMYIGHEGIWMKEPIDKLYEIVLPYTQIDNLQDALVEINNYIETLVEKVDTHDDEITAIKDQQTSLNNNLYIIDNSVETLNTNITNINSSLNNIDKRVNANTTNINRVIDIKKSITNIGEVVATERSIKIPYTEKSISDGMGIIENINLEAATKEHAGVMTASQVLKLDAATTASLILPVKLVKELRDNDTFIIPPQYANSSEGLLQYVYAEKWEDIYGWIETTGEETLHLVIKNLTTGEEYYTDEWDDIPPIGIFSSERYRNPVAIFIDHFAMQIFFWNDDNTQFIRLAEYNDISNLESKIGSKNGIAPLDNNGKIPQEILPDTTAAHCFSRWQSAAGITVSNDAYPVGDNWHFDVVFLANPDATANTHKPPTDVEPTHTGRFASYFYLDDGSAAAPASDMAGDVAAASGGYYSSWPGADGYCNESGVPLRRRVFLCVATGRQYQRSDDSSGLQCIAAPPADAKKELFIDLWNEACGVCGGWNAETGFFELNGLTDITYEQAIKIFNNAPKWTPNGGFSEYASQYTESEIRTNLPVYCKENLGVTLNSCFHASKVEVIYLPNTRIKGNMNCNHLKRLIIGDIIDASVTSAMPVLEYVEFKPSIVRYGRNNISFAKSSKLTLISVVNIINGIPNGSLAVKVTVHPDVYAKLVDEDNTEWHQVLLNAAEKDIAFITTV